jgi:hypothetical protein
MGFPAGVRRDFEALERRRMQAARLLKKGYSSRKWRGGWLRTGSRWVVGRRTERERARRAKKAGRAGRKPRLSERDRRHIVEGLKRGPEALGYGTSLWTAVLDRVPVLSERRPLAPLPSTQFRKASAADPEAKRDCPGHRCMRSEPFSP